MKYALLIPGWFPSKVNFLAGDFIERHARAASLYFPVKVLFVVKDNSLPFGQNKLEQHQISDNYETFIYYYSSASRSTVIEKIVSVWMQAKCLLRGFKKIAASYGLPSVIHAHVLLKHSSFALKKSKQHRIPLIASEQWTGYLPEASHEFESLTSFQKATIKNILEHATHVTTVSEYLAQSIKKHFFFNEHTVIPNLVDTSLFQPVSGSNDVVSFIHISTLSEQKNFEEVLQACVQLRSSGAIFHLKVFAPQNEHFHQRTTELDLESYITFNSEVPQAVLSKEVAGSDALILYSNYETFGCVIVEANACGVPVIVSDFPVFDENVIEGVTGFKVPLHHPSALADSMRKIINNQHTFDKLQIVNITNERYAFEVVGKQFANVYNLYAKP
jgi:glycosyltransferase involved in cell wall biosynthesis